MKSFSLGRLLISIVSLWAAGGSYIFDWNHTHIYNPLWPPHAKFHNAQTMLLGTVIGITALIVLWLQKKDTLLFLRIAVALASFYWITQAGALLFPGTALADPEFTTPGQPPFQLIVDVVMLIILGVGYFLEAGKVRGGYRIK